MMNPSDEHADDAIEYGQLTPEALGQVSPLLARQIIRECSFPTMTAQPKHPSTLVSVAIGCAVAAIVMAGASSAWQQYELRNDLWADFYEPMLLGENFNGVSFTNVLMGEGQRRLLLEALDFKYAAAPKSGFTWLALARGYGATNHIDRAQLCLKRVPADPLASAGLKELALAEAELWSGKTDVAAARIAELYSQNHVGIASPYMQFTEDDRNKILLFNVVRQSAQLCVAKGTAYTKFPCDFPVIASRCACAAPVQEAPPADGAPAAPAMPAPAAGAEPQVSARPDANGREFKPTGIFAQ